MTGDGLDDLARSLREEAGWEIREEAATDEHLTEQQRRRRLSLAEAVQDAMHRGDEVAVTAGGTTFSHPIVSVGRDYVTMEEGDRVIDIRLDIAEVSVSPRRSGGVSGRPLALTFTARLAELEQEGVEVELISVGGARVNGVLELVAADHVVIRERGGPRTYLPLARLAAAFSRFPPRRG